MNNHTEYHLIYNGLKSLGYTDDEITLNIEKFQSQTICDYINVLQDVQEKVQEKLDQL